MVLPPAVNSLATLTVPTAAEAPPASPVLTAPEAELPASAVVPPVMVPTPQRSVAAAGAVEAVLATLSGAGPAAPLESAVSWVMLAAARRELGSPAAAQSTPAAAVPTEPLIDTEVAPSRTATRSAVAAPAAAAGAVQAIDPIAAATAVDPITAFVEQIQAFVTGVVTAITQVVNQVVQAVTQAVTAIVNIFVPVPANSAPFAETPTVGTPDAGTGVVTGKVSASDPDGDALTYSAPASTAKGSVVIDGATGEFTYTPTDAARHGAAALDATSADLADSFTVTVADGYGGSATAVVGVVISPANRAPVAGTPTVGSPNESTGVVVGTVIASDSDGDPLTFSGSATTAKGSVVVDADGGFTYTPTAAARHQAASEEAVAADLVDSFTVTATDGYGGSATAVVGVVISPANADPVAGTPVVGGPDAAAGVVIGSVSATDGDGDPLTFSGSTTTAKGSVVVDADGGFTYTPTAAARHQAASEEAVAADLADSFTVTLVDGYGGSATAVVGVVISPANRAPVVGTPTVGSPNESTGVVVGTVIASDSDGDPLTFIGSTTTAKGSVVVDADGGFTYTPTAAARHQAASEEAVAADLVDSFTVTVADGYGGSVEVPVVVAVSPLAAAPNNSAPVVEISTVGAPDATSGVVIGQIDASDPDGDVLVYAAPASTAKGAVVIDSATGEFTYTPTVAARHAAAGLNATNAGRSDSFTVTVADGYGGTATALVSVVIAPANDAPVAGIPVVGTPDVVTGVVVGSVSASDSDGDALIFSGSTTTAKGRVVVDADGRFTYTPTAAARHDAASDGAVAADLADSFTVTVSDGHGGSVEVPVAVSVSPSNTAPQSLASFVGDPDESTGVVTGSVSASDADGDSLTYSGPIGTAKGSVVVAADGGFTYTPTAAARHDAAREGVGAADLADSFTVTVADGHGGAATAVVSVVIAPANDAPVAGSPVVGTPDVVTGVVFGSVSASDSDGDALTFSGSTTTAKGSVVVDADGGFTYTPTPAALATAGGVNATDADRTDVFTVNITDNFGGFAAVAVSVPIGTNANPGVTVAINSGYSPDYPSYVDEGDGGTTVVPVRVELSRASDVEVTVDYVVSSRYLAVAGEDFLAETGSVVFAPGQMQAEIPVTIYGDTDYEPDEVVRVELTGVTNAALVLEGAEESRSRFGSVSIINDDSVGGNAAPVAGSPTVGVPNVSSGVVIGSVNATDPDGDVLLFSGSTATAKGSVVVDADGAFTYTPTATARHDAAREGAGAADLADSFTVTVTDGNGGAATAVVSVVISPANDTPVAGPPVVSSPDTETGVVSGTVSATDGDGDSLIFSGSAITAKGSVVVNADGEFTYTPTPEARRAAYLPNATGDDLHDTFSVTLTDGHGGSAVVTSAVAIGPAVTYYVTKDVKRDPVTGVIALRTIFPESTQQPGTELPGYLNWLAVTPNVGATHLFPAEVASWDNLFLVGMDEVSDPYSSQVAMPTGAVLRNPQNGSVAIRTIFGEAEPALANMAWLIATPSQGALHVPSTSLEGWDILLVPGSTPAILGYTTADPESNGVVRGNINAVDPDGDVLTYSAPAATGKGYVVVDADLGAFVYAPTAAARQSAGQVQAGADGRFDTFTVTVSDGYFSSESEISVVVTPAPAPRAGDIRVQPGGAVRAMYAPNVTSWGDDWIGVDPSSGGMWLSDGELADWLDVASPTGAETAGFGPYQPGDVKVPPGSVAGSVTWFAVKSGPELTDMGYGWMVCNVSTACHGSSDDEVISSVSAVPIGQWADLRHPLEIELG
ncbi:MAG: tandem-95 repeat protein [Mycobacterium sp.]|nr:tandem-95 repeat protein [Mycobacterium sp.]